MTNNLIEILVVGAGAVGSYFGSLMLKANLPVTFLARGERLKQLENDGLTINSVDGDMDFPNLHVTNAVHSHYQIIFLCGKSYALPSMLDDIEPAVGPNTIIVSLQNGLGNEQSIAERYGSVHTMGGVAFIRSTRLDNGIIEHDGEGRLTLGRWHLPAPHEEGDAANPAATHQTFTQLQAALKTTTIKHQITDDIQLAIWQKLLWNIGFNLPSTLHRLTVDELLNDSQHKQTIAALMAETAAIAHAQGVDLPDSLIAKMIDSSQSMLGYKTSMLVDCEMGREIELEAIAGYPLKLAQKHNVATPKLTQLYNQLVYNQLASA